MDASQIVKAKSTSSTEAAIANDHILTEILRRLPIKSLFRSKLVSKHWFSLIADDPQLALRQNPDPSCVSGLFLYPSLVGYTVWNDFISLNEPGLDFLSLFNDKSPADDALEVGVGFIMIPNLSGLIIQSSCNGLLCCLGYNEIDRRGGYHVINPTTKQFTTLPDPHPHDGYDGLNLAFDPSRSPFYKVVNVWNADDVPWTDPDDFYSVYRIEVYSSDARSWRASSEPFIVDVRNIGFRDGIYWNGALHWFSKRGDGYYFDLEQERLWRMPALPVREGMTWYDRSLLHPLVARGHFHALEIYGPAGSQLDVYEMEDDYSGWFVKYHINLDPVAAAFPRMGQMLASRRQDEAYCVLSLVREEKDEESFLVLHVPGEIIRFNLVDQSFSIIHDLGVNETSLRYYGACHYIESYANV